MSFARSLHSLLDGVDRRWGPVLRRTAWTERSWVAALDASVALQADRRYMRRVILPAIAAARTARVLFVGVRGYTRAYGRVVARSGAEFWTTDIDPAAAPHGAPGRHVVADIREAERAFARESFNVLLLNGIFGWGVDDPAGMQRVLAVAADLLAPGGHLLIGWNADRSPDPETLGIERWFAPSAYRGLPQRKRFSDVTHVYAWYRRTEWRAPA